MVSSIKRFLIGRPLKSTELGEQKLNKTKALAILSSDALSSVAYDSEQILIALAGVGAISLLVFHSDRCWGISIIDSPYFILSSNYFCLSAWRGAYVVSKENLGMNPGLIAGGSLLVDYILTVAVSVSAGTDAITSAFPSLHAHNVIIAVIFVILITILNLRE